MLLNAFRSLFSNSQNRKARRAYSRPQLLQLESRIVPANRLVTSLADTQTGGTLREAITLCTSNVGNDTIVFSSHLFSSGAGTITLLTAQLPTIRGKNGTVTITGPGSSLLTISGNNGVAVQNFGIFDIDNGGVLTISGVTVSGANNIGNVLQQTGNGGAFNNRGFLTVSNSTISGNSAGRNGGAFYNQGILTVSNSTISGNFSTSGNGGGISNSGGLTVTNSTISGNTAGTGGGIYNFSNRQLNIANTMYCQ